MEVPMENSGKLSFGEFLADIRYVITSPAQRFSIILERGALWGSILLLVAPGYFGFAQAGGVYFDRDPFPGYSFLMPAVLAAIFQLMKGYFIHFFGRLFEGKWHYSAATGKFRDMLTVFGYSTVPGSLALIFATILFFLVPEQIGAAMRDFRAITISILVAIGVGLFIWNLILLVLALRSIYPMRDYKIVVAFLLGSVLVGIPAAATAFVALPVHVKYTYLQPLMSSRVLGFMASSPEESRGKEAKISIHVDRIVYRLKKPKHFDLVAYDPLPEKPAKETREGGVAVYGKTSIFSWEERDRIVGRIIGAPGDSVELNQGKLIINGKPWSEPYIPADSRSNASLPARRLTSSEYLILPENRHLLESAKDDWVVSRDRIAGRVLVVKWPMGWAIFSPTAFLRAYRLD